jgi:hypothetical protein
MDPLTVDRQDGRCRNCSGTLEIVAADDCSLSVECQDCGDSYDVETDAFGDCCMTYWPAMMARLGHGEDCGE